MHSSTLKKKIAIFELCKFLINTVLPPRCAGTGEIVDVQGMVSPDFWSQLQFIENPFCKICGIPFSFEIANDAICATCMERKPAFGMSRSAVTYNEASRKVILAFKYGDRLHSVHTFTPWLIRTGIDLIEQADFIVPVPLHRLRLRERQFNQSALLAQEIAARTAKPHIPDALLRTRYTVPQQGLSAKERDKNVRGAFAIKKSYLKTLKGKNVLLIDDVFTSGATLNECSRILKSAGATGINVLTIARVTKEEF
ncbi:MAG: ComF family protein [Alphaproteobacteria bacterium]|nr:ComF family protein [Alphaproteobacteria bacterium]MCK5658272.1 ComF family protein [Alphaproteobacteria bacterium]